MTIRHVAMCVALLAFASGCTASGTGASSSQGSPASPFTSASNGPTGRVSFVATPELAQVVFGSTTEE